ncbi:hypothetical protein H6F32_01680 [Anabaena sp. FACHB-1237]|uniref:hypothetical protein n=1 Tax=Anabaena sp. FACHB-1237 TaxID=2692769 RepID=UPI0016812B8C|nr:hypothetical protein [Anabaena sp. FACHB-1237]MBD2136321.1 hypothetical protein [Anabaena sp. FACHB-1237]
MAFNPQGIPSLPDLTHPHELMKFGSQLLQSSLLLVFIIIGLGIAIALINFSLGKYPTEQAVFFAQWSIRYSQLLQGLQHLALILIIIITGFFLCSTLANRYHNWEQAKVAQVAASIAGDKLEQIAPQISYITEEPYSYTTQVEGKIVKVNDKQKVTRYINLSASEITVKIDQSVDVQNRSSIYLTDYTANYKVNNILTDINSFFLEVPPPNGYSLLSNYKVERDGTKLEQTNPGDYKFPFVLKPGKNTTFKITYKAQGGPRWVYRANNQLLSKFRLVAKANFNNADFASGIVPSEIKADAKGTQFTWIFDENVSVKNPFGVFTSVKPVGRTGIIPRLLLLAPAIFLWWILLLYLSLHINLKNVAIAGGIFFACLLTLTYSSRLINAEYAWIIISVILLSLICGLARGLNSNTHSNIQFYLAAIISTICGAILPVFAFLIPVTGLTLSIAGLLSVGWLSIIRSNN